jgi:hypothetical protein
MIRAPEARCEVSQFVTRPPASPDFGLRGAEHRESLCTRNSQRRRRVVKLAQRVSAG